MERDRCHESPPSRISEACLQTCVEDVSILALLSGYTYSTGVLLKPGGSSLLAKAADPGKEEISRDTGSVSMTEGRRGAGLHETKGSQVLRLKCRANRNALGWILEGAARGRAATCFPEARPKGHLWEYGILPVTHHVASICARLFDPAVHRYRATPFGLNSRCPLYSAVSEGCR